jgi:hypothetical protein
MKRITSIIYPAFALFAFACFALAPTARAACQDACLTNNNTVQGDDALISLTTGTDNTAVGTDALHFNTVGDRNTANGSGALTQNTTGARNTAIGTGALTFNSTGSFNTATGDAALGSNTTGTDNTATGIQAMLFNTTGSFNTANGDGALQSNTTGNDNTATGFVALINNTTGTDNTATGVGALGSNTEGIANTAVGAFALASNTENGNNTAVGLNALANSTGGINTALGINAGVNLTTGNFNIYIGNQGAAAEDNTIRIGDSDQTATYIAGINGTTISRGAPVFIDANGRLGTRGSSQRFKNEIKPMDKASEAILALKPVTFRYKNEIDPDHVPQFGLVAEDVAKVNPDLVLRDADGKVYTVRYEALNAMLLNEFLKAHRRIEAQDQRIDQLMAQLKEQAALIQKVNDKIELTRPAPQTVANDQR